ncbi:hypothetical protein V5799_004475 [Amblyomma americanum]|uniref:Peptidase M13 N-terminal domain-containing protein n=1 Tax=Amblyomma americanum TaxID=6943 RepID=A0AAQ4D603_AMBAM
MSTNDKAYLEMMMWDYGPMPPPKTPLLNVKDGSAATATPAEPPITIPPKEIAAPQQPAALTAQVSKDVGPASAKAGAPQPGTSVTKLPKEAVPTASKATAPLTAAPASNMAEQPVSAAAKVATPKAAAPAAKRLRRWLKVPRRQYHRPPKLPPRPAVTKLFKDALLEVMSSFAAASAAVGKSDVYNVMNVFDRLAYSPTLAASPDTSPILYTSVKLVELESGYKNFLEKVFNSIVKIDDTTEVVLKSPDYLLNHLKAAMQELPPQAVVNYLGFMALVKAARFFPEKLSNLRQLFGKDVLDRTLPDVSQTKALCLLAVQQVLPGCFAKAAAKLRGMSRTDLPLTEWLSRLESTFDRHQERVAWIGELSALIVRYRLRTNRIAAFPWGSRQEPCSPSPQEIPRRSEHPPRFFHQVSMLQEQKRLQLVLKTGQEVRALRGEARSELATIPEYDVMRQAVHVPMALSSTRP